jgi:hypothetical protein
VSKRFKGQTIKFGMLIWWKKNRIKFEPNFFLWRDFAKFQFEKYDVDLFKGFSMEKMAQSC